MKIIEIEQEPFHELRYRTAGRKGKIVKKNLPFIKVKVDRLPNEISSFIATSDLQGRAIEKENRLLGEAVADELKLLSELKEIPKVDFIVLAGDLYEYIDCRKLGGTGDVTDVWNSFANNFEYVTGVHGNHDKVIKEKLKPNVFILDGSSISLKNIRFGGVSGIVGRPDRNQRKEEAEFEKSLINVSKNNIIVLHDSPNLESEPLNKGNLMIRNILEKKGQSIVICGHRYWEKPLATIGKNQVLNVDSRVFLFEAVN